jgi:YHS domain-containing protein
MNYRWLLAIATATAVLVGAPVMAEEKEDDQPTAVCPVMGGEIDNSISVDYKDAKVYFCCAGCIKPFQKNPEKYAAKANHQLVLTGQAVQKGCPISGKAVNDDTALEVAGVTVKFCCNGCRGKVAGAEGKEQIQLVFSDKAFAKAYKVKESETQ